MLGWNCIRSEETKVVVLAGAREASLLLTGQEQRELYGRMVGGRGGINTALALLASESHTHPPPRSLGMLWLGGIRENGGFLTSSPAACAL